MSMNRHHIGLVALLFTNSLLLSPVCTSAAPAAPPPWARRDYHITIKGLQFVPAQLEINVGDSVTWTNADIVPHTVNGTKAFDSKNLGAGQSWRFLAMKKGVFNYACAYHPTMLGVLIVK
jgi:plastocyanin